MPSVYHFVSHDHQLERRFSDVHFQALIKVINDEFTDIAAALLIRSDHI